MVLVSIWFICLNRKDTERGSVWLGARAGLLLRKLKEENCCSSTEGLADYFMVFFLSHAPPKYKSRFKRSSFLTTKSWLTVSLFYLYLQILKEAALRQTSFLIGIKINGFQRKSAFHSCKHVWSTGNTCSGHEHQNVRQHPWRQGGFSHDAEDTTI